MKECYGVHALSTCFFLDVFYLRGESKERRPSSGVDLMISVMMRFHLGEIVVMSEYSRLLR